MNRKQLVAAVVLVGVVMVVDRALLVGSSDAGPRREPPPPRAAAVPPAVVREARFPSTPRLEASAAPVAAPELERVAEPVSDRAMGRDPETAKAVLGLIGKPLGTPAEKVARIKSTIVSSGVCTADECMKTRAALEAAADRGQLRVHSSECYEVACLVELDAEPGRYERAMIDLQQAGLMDWPVPTIVTKPIVDQDGSRSATWVYFNPQ